MSNRPASDLVAILGDWSTGGASLYTQLADGIIAGATRGDIAPGTRLPPERELARSLTVSRGTVMAAYDRLRQMGWAESRRGSGTWLRDDVRRPLLTRPPGQAAQRHRELSARLLNAPTGIVDLAVASVGGSDDLPLDTLAVSRKELSALAGATGYAPQGAAALREDLASWLATTAVPTCADQLVVTTGAQQAISLCAAVALRPGDTVLMEEATYPGAIDVFIRHGARIRTVPLQGSWGDIGPLAAAIAEHRPRLVYLMPSMHNPTGRAASETRRRQIARLADENELYLVEDDTLADLMFEGSRLPPVAAYSRAGRVLTIGSLSKSVWPGLRIGWIRSHAALADALAREKASADLGTSVHSQAVARRVLPGLQQIVADRCATYRHRADVLEEMLASVLPEWAFADPDGGFSLWVRLPDASGERFAQVALRHGVAVSPGAGHCPDLHQTDRIRLSYCQPPDVLRDGVNRLASAWARVRKETQAAPRLLA